MVYRCRVCGYIFDEKDGKPFSELSECPTCKMGPDAFECIDEGSGAEDEEEVLRVAVYIHKVKSVKAGDLVRSLCEQCHKRCQKELGRPCEFYHYSDLGNYDMTSLDRPFLGKLKKDIEKGEIDIVIVPLLSMISSEIDKVLEFYKFLKDHKVMLMSERDGLKVEIVLDKALNA